MMIFIKNTSIFKSKRNIFCLYYSMLRFFYSKDAFVHYTNFKFVTTIYLIFFKKNFFLFKYNNNINFKKKKNFLKIIIFLTYEVKRHGGSRWKNLFFKIKSYDNKFYFFFKKKLKKHNYYQKKISRKITYSNIITYNKNYFRYRYLCVSVQENFYKYRGVFRGSLGDYIVTPLINCITYGSIINYHSNFLKVFRRVTVGSFSTLRFFKQFFMISNIGITKPKYSVSMGTYSIVIQKRKNYSVISLPSKQHKIFSNKNSGYIGRNAGVLKNKQYFGKASTAYHFNKVYSTRGVAKNPVDHPNGGRTRGKNSFKTPWGLIARKNK